MNAIENTKVVVTGGAGFLGSHVVRLLLDQDNEVVVLDDFSNGKLVHLAPFRDHSRLTVIEGSVTDRSDVDEAFREAQVAVHLAVLGLRASLKDPQRVNRVVVDGTIQCLESAVNNGLDLFINCSSSEVYGSAVHIPMDENHPLLPHTPYAAAKVAQDMYVRAFGETHELRWVTFRPFNMYGPNSHWQGARGELIPKMIVRAMNGKPLIVFGDGSQTRDFVYVEDVARTLVGLGDNAAIQGQCVNISSGKETSILQIASLICSEFGLDPQITIVKQPSRPGDVMRHLGGNGKLKDICDIDSFVTIEEGIGRTVEWLRSLEYEPVQLLAQEVERNWE